jgi:hypothetical protein
MAESKHIEAEQGGDTEDYPAIPDNMEVKGCYERVSKKVTIQTGHRKEEPAKR